MRSGPSSSNDSRGYSPACKTVHQRMCTSVTHRCCSSSSAGPPATFPTFRPFGAKAPGSRILMVQASPQPSRRRSRAQAFLCTMVGYGLLLRQSSIKELKITPPPRCYYSWHSLRIGGATALARQNSPVPRETLQAWGNWKSLAAMENYFQFDSPPGLHDKLFWNYLVSAADWT